MVIYPWIRGTDVPRDPAIEDKRRKKLEKKERKKGVMFRWFERKYQDIDSLALEFVNRLNFVYTV